MGLVIQESTQSKKMQKEEIRNLLGMTSDEDLEETEAVLGMEYGDSALEEFLEPPTELRQGIARSEEECTPFEDPYEKFKRISEPRINNVVDNLRKLSNMADSSAYKYTSEEIEAMFGYIEEALKKAKSAYEEDFMPKFRW